jgi:DMSO/TMAO reductase YedYZ molybdopterin-dependent catalytic subunit
MDVSQNESRRRFLKQLATGATVVALGGLLYEVTDDKLEREARAQKRSDGRPRLPPGQRLIRALRPMGGIPYEGTHADWRLRVHGEVENEITLDFQQLLKLPQTEQLADVHCVTAWTVLDAKWLGVRVADLAKMAGVKRSARHVIFEAFAGYTSNVPLDEALAPNVLVAHQLDGVPLARPNGPPVRALVPDLYFWKSAKWLKGIRFSTVDEPGYWEVRGYHNHADPWREERYS